MQTTIPARAPIEFVLEEETTTRHHPTNTFHVHFHIRHLFPIPYIPLFFFLSLSLMQTARTLCSSQLIRPRVIQSAILQSQRPLSTDSTSSPASVPWFVDQEYEQPLASRQLPPHLKPAPPTAAPVPESAPTPVKLVHAALSRSPHLDLSTLVANRTVDPAPGPPLPLKAPQGRRKRGSTYGGESTFDVPGGIWSWTVMAQV